MGKLTVVTGCMGSGKTEHLIRHVNDCEGNFHDCLVIKPEIDNREFVGSFVKSRAGTEVPCSIEPLTNLDPEKLVWDWAEIVLDEAQFQPGLYDFAVRCRDSYIDLTVYGLASDFQNEPFGDMAAVMAIADEVIVLNATCKRCGATATRTNRLSDSMEQIVVGGDDIYEALCWRCWNER